MQRREERAERRSTVSCGCGLPNEAALRPRTVYCGPAAAPLGTAGAASCSLVQPDLTALTSLGFPDVELREKRLEGWREDMQVWVVVCTIVHVFLQRGAECSTY